MTEEIGPGAGRTTDPSMGVVTERIAALQKRVEDGFDHVEQVMNERRDSDLTALGLAKTTADDAKHVAKEANDAIMENHNQLIGQMREQAQESQRQLDKLTDTYATKVELNALEILISQRLKNIEDSIGQGSAGRVAARGVWTDLKGVVIVGFTAIALLIAIATYLAQN